MKIYTKTGDKGETSLIGNERVEKCDPRVEAYGNLDELNAYLGLIKNLRVKENAKYVIEKIQLVVFDISAYIACCSEDICKKFPEPKSTIIKLMEDEIDKITATQPKQFEFSIPANNTTSAEVNICRTVCRRTERSIIAVHENFHEKEFALSFINRLSDYLYALYLECNYESQPQTFVINN